MTLRLGPLRITLSCDWTPSEPVPVDPHEGSRRMAEVVRNVADSIPVDDEELAGAKPVKAANDREPWIPHLPLRAPR